MQTCHTMLPILKVGVVCVVPEIKHTVMTSFGMTVITYLERRRNSNVDFPTTFELAYFKLNH